MNFVVYATASECVVAGDVLRTLNVTKIDLINIDIEGSEPAVLRCFPFEEFRVHAVLMETAVVKDFRALDLFFHRHNFVNGDTFVSRWTADRQPPKQQMAIQDHVFVRRLHMGQPPKRVGAVRGRVKGVVLASSTAPAGARR